MIHFFILILCSIFVIWASISLVFASCYKMLRAWAWKQSASQHIHLICILVALSTLMTLSLVGFSLKNSFRPLFYPELDHGLNHGGHHLHLCINHLQQDWNTHGLIVIISIILILNKQLLSFIYRTWKYFVNRTTVVRLSQKKDNYYLLNTTNPMIFTMGFLRPKVFCSEGLINQVSQDEFESLMAHENCHVMYKDSMVKWLVRSLTTWYFNQGNLNNDLNLRMEQRADQCSLKHSEGSANLKALLERFENWGSMNYDENYYCAFSRSQTSLRLNLMSQTNQDPVVSKSIDQLIHFGLFSALILIFIQSQSTEQLHHFIESFWSFLIS